MISVNWSNEDGEYVATSDDYPSLSWLAPDAEEAYRGLAVLIFENL